VVAGEVREPTRNLPWAIVRGVGIVIVLYVATNFAYLHVLSIHEIVTSSSTAYPHAPSVASRAVTAALDPRLGIVLPLLFGLSALGSMHATLLGVQRVMFAMSRDGLLPRSVSRLTATTRTPAVAISIYACVGAVLSLLGGFDRLANMAGIGYLLFYALNVVGLLRWRHRNAATRHDPVARVPTWVPLLFLAAVLCLLVTLIARGTVETLAALALTGIGLPVYAVIRHRRGATS
jgi:APA family basic amino acid/polyamine antiporter